MLLWCRSRNTTAGQRAQIAVSFNKRFGHGGDRANPHNDGLKTRKDLAKEAGVGTRTIDRAVKVEKSGGSEQCAKWHVENPTIDP